MTANSADNQSLWGFIGGDGGDGGDGQGAFLARQAPNDAGPVVFGDLFFSLAASGNADLTGTSALTFTTSADLKGQAPLSGTSSLTFTTAGTLTGIDPSTAIDGATSYAFTTSGALTGAATATGTTSLTFATAGNLAGNGVLSGSAPLTFATAGNLNTAAALTASTSFAFTTGGTLNGAALIGGSSFPTFALAGTLATDAALTGAVVYQFTPAGALDGEGGADQEQRRSGGWLPVIYLDKDGNEVNLAQAVEIAIDAAPTEEKEQIEQIAETVAPLVDGSFISAQIAADMARVTAILDRFDVVLAEAIRRDIITARQAAIEEEVALILLMAS